MGTWASTLWARSVVLWLKHGMSSSAGEQVVDQVSSAARVSLARTQRQRRLLESQMTPYGMPPPPPPTGKASVEGPSPDEVEEAFRARMDAMGYRVGWVMAERLVPSTTECREGADWESRLCRDRPRFPQAAHSSVQATGSGVVNPVGVSDTLEIVKFVCKDLSVSPLPSSSSRRANALTADGEPIKVAGAVPEAD